MKRLPTVLTLIVLTWITAACGVQEKAEIIFVNGLIMTMDQEQPEASALAIKDGRVLACGERIEVLRFKGAETTVFDLEGRTVIPGLHDAHVHFESGARSIREQLSLRFMNLEQIQNAIAEVVAASPAGALIRAFHFNQAYFPGKEWPSCHDLDVVAPGNPVMITRVDGHSLWLNSKAMTLAGIDESSVAPPGGEIGRFPDGKPNGILKETATRLAAGVKGPAMILPGISDKNHLEAGIEYANRLGLTSVTSSGSLQLLEELAVLRRAGKLNLRFNVWLPIENLAEYKQAGIAYRQGDDWIRVSFLKIFADGTIGSATAAMFSPFLSNPDSQGLLIHPQEELERLIAEAHKENWPVGVHAIGNRGVNLTLSAIEKAQALYPDRFPIHRIEHAQFVHDKDLARFRQLGVIASMQPTHCTTDLLVVEDRVGREVACQGYRWRSLTDAGASIAFGTDWPVEPLDPRRGLYSAIERKNIEENIPEQGWFPEEAISLPEAILYYTLGPSQAAGNADLTGSLTQGKAADFTVFDGDLSTAAARDKRSVLTIPVYLTVVDGRVVYSR